jgi:hypothetical protein
MRDHLVRGGRRSNAFIAEMTGVVWVRSYVSDADGGVSRGELDGNLLSDHGLLATADEGDRQSQ